MRNQLKQVSAANCIAKSSILDVWVSSECASAVVSEEHQNQYGMEDFRKKIGGRNPKRENSTVTTTKHAKLTMKKKNFEWFRMSMIEFKFKFKYLWSRFLVKTVFMIPDPTINQTFRQQQCQFHEAYSTILRMLTVFFLQSSIKSNISGKR